MKRFFDFLVSTKMMAVLLLVYAFSMGYATFVENNYGTPAAKATIYEARWFEFLMLFLILNFIANIFRYRLLRKEKWPTLVFHLSFILIFIGGAVTRYFGFEGVMKIAEGDQTSEIFTDKFYFKAQIEKDGDRKGYQEIPYILSPLTKDLKGTFVFNEDEIKVSTVDFIQRKKDSLYTSGRQKEYLHFVIAGESGRENYYLLPGESKNINNILVSYNKNIDGGINIIKNPETSSLQISVPQAADYMVMATQEKGKVTPGMFSPLQLRSLYTIGNIKMVVPNGIVKGNLQAIEGDKKKDKDRADLLKIKIQGPKSVQYLVLPVEKGNPNLYKQISLDGYNMIFGFGPKVVKAPFALRLDNFIMQNYPGSNSPSAYESHVSIIDEGKATPTKIFMNNVLDYKGYRFFQASFFPDQTGTILSVNHDFWGTHITYLGYFFLFTGMFVSLFWKGSHFYNLIKIVSKTMAAQCILFILGLGILSGTLSAQSSSQIDMHGKIDGKTASTQDAHLHAVDSQAAPTSSPTKIQEVAIATIVANNKIPKEHAEKFGSLLVQNVEGRIIPVNTQATEILKKLYKSDVLKDGNGNTMDANQWFLSMNIDTPSWAAVPIIFVNEKAGEFVRKKAKINEKGYTSLINLFPTAQDGQIYFVFEKEFKEAFRKKPANQTNEDTNIISLNEKVQIFNEFFIGQFLRAIPVKNDVNHRWNSWLNAKIEPDEEAQAILGPYLASVMEATKTGNWANADAELEKVKAYQQKWGKDVLPSPDKVKAEILMNKVDINFKLLIFYSILGSILTALSFIALFYEKQWLNTLITVILGISCLGFIAQFLGLAGRWYVSGHAPWSNGYEAIIFISWIGILVGLLFYFLFRTKVDSISKGKNKKITNYPTALIPAAGFMVAVAMMGMAHGGSALDPQITPLVPVLKSYWLIIHVAIIAGSYGFFGFSMVIAMIVLLFGIIASPKMYELRKNNSIKILTIVSEMALTVGLFFLTVGTFMGGIWANESWGRYWSWDPKETWAFISVIVYAFVLHMRLVPGLRGRWAYHVATMFTISTVIMTYVGVNYYLAGLHSYAKGDPIPVPFWIKASLVIFIILALFSYFKFKAFERYSSKH